MKQRDRRALWMGGAVVLSGLLFFRVLPVGWSAWRDARESLASEQALLARAEGALQMLDSVEQRAAVTRVQVVGLAPRLLAGTTNAEALADLNGRLAFAASGHRTRLLRADPVADSARESRLRRVRLRIEVESDWSGLAGFLRATVADPAALRVTAVSVRGAEVPAATVGAEVLSGEVEVTGWYLEGGSTHRGGMK
ncbi:MAG: hypothetical protein ABIZ71_04985 [Gemmatimonadales bacterium]